MNNNFRRAREQNNFTQEEVAKRLGVSRTAYVRYEKGERECSFDTLGNLANILSVTTDYLLGRETAAVSLSKKQTTLLNMFDGLNDMGQSTLMNVAGSLKMSHAKQNRSAGIVQKNSGGTNFFATGGNNNYSIVTP